ncbi:hypothetical protein BC830DRAFT_1142438 [Chytriomyces sp. MP71]|nr:hypothetical protein BC830DRAFT_1142438 [Chytriomyces sp. MP71]
MKHAPQYQKVDPSKRCKKPISKELRREIWAAAPHAPGFSPTSFRLDVLGSLVCKKHNAMMAEHNNEGPLLPLAYDIEHITPRSHGGKTEAANLCLLAASVNRFKVDAHLWLCGLPAVHNKIKPLMVDPARVLRTFRSWNGAKRVKERYHLELVRGPEGLLILKE